MPHTPVPRFVVFARKLTLVSGLALPLAGCADKAAGKNDAATVGDSGEAGTDMLHPGVKPIPQDAADDSDVQNPAEGAADVAAEAEACRAVMGLSPPPPDT